MTRPAPELIDLAKALARAAAERDVAALAGLRRAAQKGTSGPRQAA